MMRSLSPIRSRGSLLACMALAPLLAGAAPVVAQHVGGHDHSAHGMTPPAARQAPLSEASQAYEAASQKMHREMSAGYTNDVDVDFVRGMIPHHQGAIDQAEILLKYSTNPRLRRLAGGIIAAQRREIRFMQKWLKERASGAESSEMPAWMRDAPSTAEEAARKGDRE